MTGAGSIQKAAALLDLLSTARILRKNIVSNPGSPLQLATVGKDGAAVCAIVVPAEAGRDLRIALVVHLIAQAQERLSKLGVEANAA